VSKYLLDTTVLISYLRGIPGTVSLIEEMAETGHTLGCCCITITEVYSGLRRKDYPPAQALIERLRYFEAPLTVALRAGEFRNQYAGQGITLATSDALIAAVAEAEGAILLTGNVRHYPMTGSVKIQKT